MRRIAPTARTCEIIALLLVAPRTRAELCAHFGVRTGHQSVVLCLRELHQHGLIYVDATNIRSASGYGPNAIRFAWQSKPFENLDADGGLALSRYKARTPIIGGTVAPYVRPKRKKKAAVPRKPRPAELDDPKLVPVQRVVPATEWARKPAGLAPAAWHEVIG